MKDKSFKEQIEAEAMKAYRAKDASRHFYYCEMLSKPNLVACASYETFSGSHLYKSWMEKNSRAILNLREEWQRVHVW